MLNKIDQSWTLFLDRDGVINYEKKDDYIYNWNEFKFYEDAKEAIKLFSKKFGRIIVVSNQRGVGRKLMTEEALRNIHENMTKEIIAAGGRVDRIYYCTAIDNLDNCRKPNPGMAFKAQLDFPEIDFSKSIMVGNKYSDMLFGRNAQMHTVYLTTTHPNQPFPHSEIDLCYDSLLLFANDL